MRLWRRKVVNALMLGLTGLCTAIVLVPLFLILFQVLGEGVKSLNWAFFTHMPQPPGESGGGMANAIAGTIELLIIAMIVGIPLGIAGGVYVSELAYERFGLVVRFCADAMTGIPTIVTGLFVYALVVVPAHSFSGIAGGIALAMVMIPVVLRAADEVLRMVPHSYREAALALGATRWLVLRDVVLRAAKAGLISAAMLGVARVIGETAPLLMTAFNNNLWSIAPGRPMASLTVQVFNYALGPYDDWHRQAWAAALTLICMVIALNVVARLWGGARERA